MKKTLSLFIIISLLAGILCFSGCSGKQKNYTSFAMGSILTATLYTDEEKADELYEELNNLLQTEDKCLSATNTESDIYKLNTNGKAVVSKRTIEVLKNAVLMCNTTGRILDITIGSVSELWGFATETPTLPGDSAIKEALKTVDAGEIEIDEDNNKVTLGEGQQLDLGAIGKGSALDIITETLRRNSVPAVLSFGGTVAVYGENPSNKKGWTVGIRDPKGSENDYLGVCTVKPDTIGGALYFSTSGSYEKTFEKDGKTYHHILSTETGYPVETDLVSVTVISSGGITADALSTILFINGCDDYAKMILDSFSAGAIFVYEDGSIRTLGKYTDTFSLTSLNGYQIVTDEE